MVRIATIDGNALPVSATLVVASSGSLYPQGADYVCDGTADEVQINAALTTGGAGAKVILLEGTYTLADPIAFTNNNQTLEGQGRGSFIDGDGLATTEHAISITGLTNCVIKNLAIQTEDAGTKTCHCIFIDNGCNSLLIENVVIVDSDSDGIHIEGTTASDITIRGCHIDDVDDNGISIDMDAANYMYRLHILDNVILSAGANGIYTGTTGAGCDYGIIEGNRINGAGSEGMELSEFNYGSVAGNTVQSCTAHGIALGSSTLTTISANTCTSNDSGGSTYHGIQVMSSDKNTVVGNTCSSNGLHGVYVHRSDHCSVTGNVCTDQNTGDGINVTGDGTDNADYNTIVGNICTDNADDGVAVEGTTDANKNIVVGNHLIGNAGTALVDNGTTTQLGHNITA